MAAQNSRYRLLAFSGVLFLVIFIAGSVAFILSMKDIVHSSSRNELRQVVKTKRLELETSVNNKIALILKMADSPLIQHYFAAPEDPELEKEALEEIAGYRRALAKNSIFWVNDIDKKFYSDSSYAFTVDTKDPGNYWYYMTLNETEKYNFNINYNPELQKINLWINAPVFDNKRKPIGIVGSGIDLTVFVQSVYQDFSKDASLYFFNSAGEITGAIDTSLISSKIQIGKLLGSMGEKILSLSKNIDPNKMEDFSSSEGEVMISQVPVLGWYMVAIQPISMRNYLETNMTATYLATVFVIALIIIIFNIYVGELLKPLKKMSKKLNEISSNWDLTNRIEISSKNEMGTMASSFNHLIKALKAPIAETKTATTSLASASKELSLTSKHLSASSEEMVSRAANVTSRMERMATNIKAMANGAEAASVNSNEVAKTAEQMSANMNTIAAAVEEMSASINQIANNANEAHKVSEEATAKSGNATTTMGKLESAAKEIGQVTDVIKKIADKTNLLALNATIEAASAGEAGKGFAVVAGEIKELANQSSKSADDISRMIDGIQTETNEAISVIKDVSKIIVKINSSVEAIAEYVNQQTKASNEIASHIAQANTGAQKVALAIGEVAKSGNEIASNAGDAARRVGQVADDVNSMSAVAKESSKEVVHLSSSVGDLEKMADNLEMVIGKFKV